MKKKLLIHSAMKLTKKSNLVQCFGMAQHPIKQVKMTRQPVARNKYKVLEYIGLFRTLMKW